MATSSSDNFSTTRNKIIDAAFRKIGIVAEGEAASGQMVDDAALDLERMVKVAQAAGLHLWKYEEMILFLDKDQQKYVLGPSTSEHWLKSSDLISTTLSAASVANDTSMTVTSITGIAASDNVGVVLDDNTIHWTTVSGTPSGSTVTLTTGVASAAASGNVLYAYKNKAVKPLAITQVRTRIDSNSELTHQMLSRDEYFSLANKAATGSAIQSYYSPRLLDGNFYPWPTSDDEREFLNLTAQIQIEDLDAAGNNPDFPSEWYDALVWNLAKRLLTEYGIVDPMTVQLVLGMAQETYDFAEAFDAEETNIVFMPDYDG